MISAAGVGVTLGDVEVLRDVHFECARGEFVAIVGASGSGKSSFLNAVANLVPYDGRIAIEGSVGYVFQSYALFPWMTVRQNVAFGLDADDAGRKARVDDLLERVEMSALAERYPSQLSGGQVQRVALARALAPSPDVLLMDEPYAALDQRTRERMQVWLLSVWETERTSVLFVTHNMEEAIYLADRVVVLSALHFDHGLRVPFPRPRRESLRFETAFLEFKQRVLELMDMTGES